MHYDALLKKYSSYGRDMFEALKLLLWAVGVLAGSPVVDGSRCKYPSRYCYCSARYSSWVA